MSKLVDRDEAPEGCVAKKYGGKKWYSCSDCVYCDDTCPLIEGTGLACIPHNRADRQSVIFMKRKE